MLRKLVKKIAPFTFAKKPELVAEAVQAAEAVIVSDNWGMRFTYYPYDSENLEVVTKKEFYKPELLAMRKLVNKGDTVVDLGANIGMFSVYLGKEIGDTGKLYAFEPVRDTYWRMMENLSLNRSNNVTTYQQAVSNKIGKAKMNIFPAGYGAWNTFGKPTFGKIKPVSTELVEVTTIDTFVAKNKLRSIDFLKIDVEGFELDVLEGAKKSLKNGLVKYLSFEISEIPLKGAGRRPDDVFSFLKELGYKAYEFNEKTKKFHGPIDMSDTFYQNFYASKKDLRKL